MSLGETLEPTCEELRVLRIHRTSANRPVIKFRLRFSLKNVGPLECDMWDIAATLQNCPFQLVKSAADSPAGGPEKMPLDTTIGPTLAVHKDLCFEVTVDPGVSRAELI